MYEAQVNFSVRVGVSFSSVSGVLYTFRVTPGTDPPSTSCVHSVASFSHISGLEESDKNLT